MEILWWMMRRTCTKGNMCGKVVGSIEKYFWVSMVKVMRIRVHVNFIITNVSDELRMVVEAG